MNLKIALKPQQGYNKIFDVGEYGMKLTKFGLLKLAKGTSYAGDTGEEEVAFVLIGGNLHTDYLYGIAILFLAAIGSTGYTAICKKLANKGYNPFAIVTWQFILAIGFFLVPFLIWDAPTWTPQYLSWPVLRPIIALAVLCSGVAFVIYAACVDKIGMTRTTVFLPLVAIVSAVAASLLGQDNLHPLQMAGIVVAMAGVVMAQYTNKKKNNEA